MAESALANALKMLDDFVPSRVLDAHAHTYRQEDMNYQESPTILSDVAEVTIVHDELEVAEADASEVRDRVQATMEAEQAAYSKLSAMF